MFQKGRSEQPIKYKAEVLKKHPKAVWFSISGIGGAIHEEKRGKRISECYKAAWQAWEDAYYKLLKTN